MPRIALVLVLAAFSAGVLGAQPRPIAAIAHRGEHLTHPENTLPAFEAAVRAGADYIEADVRTTADGVLAIMHDARVDRTTNGVGELATMTLAQLKALDAGGGAKVPTFDEVLDFARGQVAVYVDVKQADPSRLSDCIARHGMTDSVAIYGGRDFLAALRAIAPKLKIMPEARDAAWARQLRDSLRPEIFAFDASDFLRDAIDVARTGGAKTGGAKTGGAKIFVDRLGASDNAAAWREAVEMGADGIQTDHPAELVRFLREQGYARPHSVVTSTQ